MTPARQYYAINRRRALVTALYLSTGRLIVAYTAHLHAYFLVVRRGVDEVAPAFKSLEPDSCLGCWAGECEKDLSALFCGEYYGGRLTCTAVEFDRTLRHGGPDLPRRVLGFWRRIHNLCGQYLIGGEGVSISTLASAKNDGFTPAVQDYYDIKHGIFDRHYSFKDPSRNLNL